eukprot:1085196-Heterocapsa_arctica.AAC.1
MEALCRARSVFFPTKPWARATAISHMGPFFRIPGAPKCPRAVIDACSLVAFLREATWGPAQLMPHISTLW